jgi:hypothetical protein
MLGRRDETASEVDPDLDNDFVIRQIRQLVRALAKWIAGRPTALEVQQAEETAREAARAILRVDLEMLERLLPDYVLRLLGERDRIRGYVELLEGIAALRQAAGDEAGAQLARNRAQEIRRALAAPR